MIFLIMYIVYVLYSRAFDKCYVGFTTELSSGLGLPNELRTSNSSVWEANHSVEFGTKKVASQWEKE
uniref:hypothetical protein n=1 Tax=Algoriphagus sp. TaxID=1872435 RepID=UPI00404804D9